MKRFSSLFITLFILIACQNQVDVTQTLPANTSIEFPEWVKNPDIQILLVPVGTQDKGYENMALFNAETGERFDIPFTEQVGDYFWMPNGDQIGFLPTIDQIILFSIKDGTKSIIPVSKDSRQFLGYSSVAGYPLQILITDWAEMKFYLIGDWQTMSPDRRFFVYQEKYDETHTSVFDTLTNQLFYLTDPNDEYNIFNSEFSPDSQFLAIAEVNQEIEMWNRFEESPTFILSVYDLQTQKIIATYKNVTSPTWSPDGKKFLFQEWKNLGGTSWNNILSPPCVFYTITGKTHCYDEVLPNSPFMSLDSVSWSPDQTLIGYLYSEGSQDGFCIISQSTGDKSCMLEGFNEPEDTVITYQWSPDSNFISFVHDFSCSYCDFSIDPQIAIANVKTGEYFSIGDKIFFSGLGLWRSSPNQ